MSTESADNHDLEDPQRSSLELQQSVKDETGSTTSGYTETTEEQGSLLHSSDARVVVPRKLLWAVLMGTILVGLAVGLTVGLVVGNERGQESASLLGATDASSSPDNFSLTTGDTATTETNPPQQTQQPVPEPALPEPVVAEPVVETTPPEPATTAPVEAESTRPPLPSIGSNGFSIGIGAPPTDSWPNLVGLRGEEAKQIIEDEGKGYEVFLVPSEGVTTKDYRTDRVFVYLNDQGFVEKTPRPGR